MENKIKRLKAVFTILIIMFIAVFSLLVVLRIGQIGLFFALGQGAAFLMTVILASYYFGKYLDLLDFSMKMAEKAARSDFAFKGPDYREEYSEIIGKFSEAAALMSEAQNVMAKAEVLDDRRFSGSMRDMALKYNAQLKASVETYNRLDNEYNRLKGKLSQLAGEAAAISSTNLVSLHGYDGDLYKLAESINALYQSNARQLSELGGYVQRLGSDGIASNEPTVQSEEMGRVYRIIKEYAEAEAAGIRDLNEAVLRISKGERDLGLRPRSNTGYTTLVNNLQRLARDYYAVYVKPEQRTASVSERPAYVPKRTISTRDNPGKAINSAIPKTPKIKENLDYIFESRDFGKY